MTWSYSGDPGASDLDYVRFLVRDTDTSVQKITDEEITFLLSKFNNNIYQTAMEAANSISAFFGSRADTTIGRLSISYVNQSKFYGDLAASLREQWMRQTPPLPRAFGNDGNTANMDETLLVLRPDYRSLKDQDWEEFHTDAT